MESLVRTLFTDLNKQVNEFSDFSNDFEVIDARLREQTDQTIEQSDRLEGRLSTDNLEAKIMDFESLIKKLDVIQAKVERSIDANKLKKICDVTYDSITRACFYGFGAIAASITAFNDITDELVDVCETPTWLKVYRSASAILILPFIYGVEENLKKKEMLRADRGELKTDVEERLCSAEIFLKFLVHRKARIEMQQSVHSPENDDRLADLLEGVPYFRGIKDAEQHERELLHLAKRRLSQSPDSPNSPGSRLKAVFERAMSQSDEDDGSCLKIGFRQGSFQLRKSFKKRELKGGASARQMPNSRKAGLCHPTIGFSDVALAVTEAHRGSSDEHLVEISLRD